MRRTHWSGVRSVVACLVCGGVLVLAPAASAQEQDKAFKDGLDARDSKKWREAADHMRQAVQADGKESARKVRTGIFGSMEYLPYYFLGEALFNLGDCAGAIEAWANSEQQGAINARSESVAFLQRGYGVCEGKGVLPPARYTPLLAKTRQQVTDVTSLGNSVFATARDHNELWTVAMKEQYERANGELQNAQARLANATRTRLERDFSDASTAAERARTAFRSVQTELTGVVARSGAVQGITRETEQALESADAIERTLAGKKSFMTPALLSAAQNARDAANRGRSQMAIAQRTLNEAAAIEARALAQDALGKYQTIIDTLARRETAFVADAAGKVKQEFTFVVSGFDTYDRQAVAKPEKVTPEMTAKRESLQKLSDTARRRLESAERGRDLARLHEVERTAADIRKELQALNEAFGPLTLPERGVRVALIEGARQYFAGEYAQVLATLDPSALGDGLFQHHIHLFRAAAHYALFVRSGEKDQSQRTQAVAEIERVKQISPEFSPDMRVFAPRFLAFFQAEPASPPQATPPQQR